MKINNELVRTPYELTPPEFVSVRIFPVSLGGYVVLLSDGERKAEEDSASRRDFQRFA